MMKWRTFKRRSAVIQALDAAKWWVLHRTIYRFHTVRTGLKPGYNENGTRMMHAMFTLLVDYVESELAWMHYICQCDKDEPEGDIIFNTHVWYQRLNPFKHFGMWFRDKHMGLRHLDWEMRLTYGEDMGLSKDDPDFGKLTPQATSAQEIHDLYIWWTMLRPYRKDPYFQILAWEEADTEVSDEVRQAAYRECEELEAKYLDEDTEMLNRLVAVRGHLST